MNRAGADAVDGDHLAVGEPDEMLHQVLAGVVVYQDLGGSEGPWRLRARACVCSGSGVARGRRVGFEVDLGDPRSVVEQLAEPLR